MTTSITGTKAAVVGSAEPPAAAVVAALRGAGASVAVLPRDSRALGDGELDLVVHVADCRGTDRALVDLDEQAWDAAAEAPARELLETLQHAHGPIQRAGGRLVVVLPAVALEGAAGLVAETTGWETMRLLAKSAARRWAAHGIAVHIVAVHLDETRDARLSHPVLGPEHAGVDAVASVVALLATDRSRSLTGQTLVVDGGALMLP